MNWRMEMFRILSCVAIAVVLVAGTFCMVGASAEEPVVLIGTIVKWRYPEAEIGPSTMTDAATIDAEGNRTVPSTVLLTTMTTRDPVEKVLSFYRDLLKRTPEHDKTLGIAAAVGRSVYFSDESAGRPFAMHTILVNSANSSTTLVISRGKDEEATHITWKQYLRHEVGR